MARELLAIVGAVDNPGLLLLIDHLRARTGAGSREARRMLSATVTILAECLDPPVRRLLLIEVGDLGAGAQRMHERPSLDAVELGAEIGRRAHLTAAHAVEATEACLEALAGALPEELLVRMRKLLHPSVAALLATRDLEADPPAHVRHHPPYSMHRGPTLSTGRPGFQESLAEGKGGGASGQSGSVTAEQPHEDTKISTAHGTTQEQDDRTLAESGPMRWRH